MSITIQWANSNKRRNSTKQFQPGTDSHITVTLKENTSVDHPTFIVSASWIGWNVCKWGDRYYFVDDVVSIGNNLWEVSCVMDVLATYKADILASTQFVSYSNESGGTWLPDTRIPSKVNGKLSATGVDMDCLDHTGFYAMTVVGSGGARIFALDYNDLGFLSTQLSTWKDDNYSDAITGVELGVLGNYDWSTPEESLKSSAKMNVATTFLSLAWNNAVNCIRSCIWVPYKSANFKVDNGSLFLGEYDTHLTKARLTSAAKLIGTYDINIPWQFSDWRRVTNEHLYLWLPFVGLINLSTADLCQASSIRIEVGGCVADGSLKYVVRLPDKVQPIGVYGGNVGSDYAIGINQGTSPYQQMQTQIQSESELNAAISSFSLLSPGSWYGAIAQTSLSATKQGLERNAIQCQRTASCIGSFGGSSFTNSPYDKHIAIYSIANDTATSPSSMASTMGVPTMKPMSLANLTGYVQCTNAHVECNGSAPEKDAVDTMLNSGIFIE